VTAFVPMIAAFGPIANIFCAVTGITRAGTESYCRSIIVFPLDLFELRR
jgi:hypothetical protein